MKKKNEIQEKPEIVEDPTKRFNELKKINEEMSKLNNLEESLKSILEETEKNLQDETSHDPEISKSDTVNCILLHFEKILKEFSITKEMSQVIREKLYYLFFNTSVLIFDYCHRFRKNKFSLHGIKYLTWVITLFESNIILSGIKYLRWKNKLYSELAFLYEDLGAFKSSFKVVTQALNKLQELKSIEEQQGVLPEYIKISLLENFRILKNLEMKYGLISGNYQLEVWKKKLDDTFVTPGEKFNKYLCGVNSISNLSYFSSIIFHDGLKLSWKPSAVSYFYELLKTDITNIKTGLQEFIQKNKREVEKREKIKSQEKNYTGVLQENSQLDSTLNKQWKISAKNVPLEIHMELLKAAYDCKMWKEFNDLLESLNVRINYRNVETPFISEIDVIVSSIPYSNIANKFEKIDMDLNINNYKAEIKKLREQGKYVGGAKKEDDPVQGKEPKSQKDQKDTKNKDKNAKAPQEEVSENPYEKIEGLNHSYVYLLLRRSHNPKKAIVDFKILMSNDSKINSYLSQDQKAIAIPIKTYEDNLYEQDNTIYEDIKAKIQKEKNKLLPYLIYKKTSSDQGLNDEEKLNALVDLIPMISNSPFSEAPINFRKNPLELSLIKNSDSSKKSALSYNFSHNYINVCSKTDDIFHIIQREAEIIKNLYELEHSYIDHSNTTTHDFKSMEKVDKFLLLTFPLEKLEVLSASLNGAIQGHLGNYFLDERRNFLNDICVLIWNKYLKELLGRIDYFHNIHIELEEDDRFNILEKINKIQYQLFIIILNIHFVLSNIKNKDPIIYSFLTSRLADYSERTENISVGVEMLSKALEYLNQYREEENIFGMNNLENKHTFTTFTCDNNKIRNLILNNEKKFFSYVQELNLKRRRNIRKQAGLGVLTVDEEDEEDFENISLEGEYENRLENIFKKVLKKFSLDEISEKEKNNFFISENENTLNCIFVELNVKFYKLYLKNGFIEKQNNMHNSLSPINTTLLSNNVDKNSNFNNSNNSLQLSGSSRESSGYKNRTRISNSTIKKLDIIKGQSATKVKESIDCLKQSLQEAGKMEPDKPTLQRYERTMLLNISRNVYLNTIFQFSMAGARSNKQDQKYFLTQSSNSLSKCFEEEDARLKYYENYFFFIKSFQNFNQNTNQNASYFYPYSMMYKSILIENSEKIPEPILLYKTSSTATFIFPIVKIKTSGVDSKYKKTGKVSLFGQQSTGTNIVQLNNKQLPGTGSITSVMNYVTVNNLKPNEKYIFAYAGYDSEDVLINGIGNTSKEVESYFPLPIYYITYHLCKISYEFKYHEICREKAKSVFNYFTEKTELKDLQYDSKSSALNLYKLKYDYFLNTCFMEMEGIAYTFYLYAKCVMYLKINDHTDDNGVNIVAKQKNILKILNILSLALEIACYIRHFQYIKLFTKEIYSLSVTFLKQKNLYKELAALFIKLSLSLNIIPNDLWDRELRNLSSLISYQLLLLLVNNCEIDLYRKLLVKDLGLQKKRFYFFKYKYMKKFEETAKKGGKPGEKDKPTPLQASGGSLPGELTETEAVLFKDLEKESAELDEYLLCMGEFNDICKIRITQHITCLEKYASNFSSSPELQTELEKRKKDLNDLIEVFESFKNEGGKYLQKFAQTFRETSDKYYEFCSKLLKKTIENILQPGPSSINAITQPPGKTKDNLGSNLSISDMIKISEDIQIKETDVTFVQGIFSQKINFLTNDVIFIMKVRIKEFLNKIEKEEKNKSSSQGSSSSQTEEINLDKIRIQIEEKYFGSSIENEKFIPYETFAINDVYLIKEKYFWIGDLIYNKAVLNFVEYIQNHKSLLNLDFNNFMGNYKLVDIAKISYVNENIAELNMSNLSQEKDPIIRHKRRTNIFEKLSYSSLFMRESSSSISIDNLMNFAYNILLYDMMSPIESGAENFWCYLNIISETAMKRLEKIKYGEDDFSQTDYEKEIENLKSRLCDKENIKAPMNFNTMKNFSYGNIANSNRATGFKDSFSDQEKLIENLESKVNLDIYIEFICFTIQCTYVAKKWNILSNLIQNFNSLTNDNFGNFTLAYLIEAQKNIYEKADENAKNKKLEIEKRVALYETWKNSRKKNKRQQMITGEVPQEQIDFEKDYSILSKEFFILESISNLLKNDKEKSEKQYNNLINDSNNSLKAVNSCRKLFEKYQMEASILANFSSTKGENSFEVKNKTKAIKMFSSNLINLYKKSIQILKKRQENYLLIQMLYEMSLVYYSELDYKNAEIYFNEALDTVFQKLYSLKDFRNFFNETNSKSSLVEKYGIRQLLYAVMILHKLGKFCYDTELYMQRECATMSGEIIYNILISSMPNPPSILNFGLFRLNEINKNLNIFKTSENVNPADLLTSCIEIVDVLNSYQNYELTLPLLALCEHLSCDIVKNTNYVYKSRILKIISLAELGMISEAMQIFYKISKKFDLPSFISNTISVEKNNGKFASLTKEFKYNNTNPADNAKNQETLFAFSKIFLDTELKNSLGCSLYCELLYARNLIYFKLYEKENYAIFLEKSDGRIDWLQRVEKEMRENLLMIAANEELNILNSCMEKLKFETNSESFNLLNKKIEEILSNRKITKEEYENFYLAKFNKKNNDLRDERINLICKIRILLARVFNSQGLYLGSSGVVLKSLENMKKLTQNNFIIGVEIADDYAFDFKPSDALATNSKGGAGAKNPPPQKPGNDKKGPQVQSTISDEEINKIISNLLSLSSERSRNHPNSIYWFTLQNMHLTNLYKLSRYEDCLNLIKKLSEYTNKLGDTFFFIRFKEVEILIHCTQFNLNNAEKSYLEIQTRSKSNFINDIDHAVFLGNYSEFLFFQNKYEDAISKIKEARKIVWLRLARMNYLINSQSYFNEKIIKGLDIDKHLKSQLKEKESIYLSGQPGQPSGNSAKKPAETTKKKDEVKSNEISQMNFNQKIEYSQTGKYDDIFEKPSKDINECEEGENLYFKFTDLVCRLDIRYVYFNLMSSTSSSSSKINLEGLISVLDDLLVMSQKLLYPHNSFKIILFFLIAKINKITFINDIYEYLKEKMSKVMKKFNLEILTSRDILIKFSNYFNKRCVNKWTPSLKKAKEYLEKSVSLLQGEFYTFELGFNTSQILLELSDVNLLLCEYRPYIINKYCDFNQVVNKVNSLILNKKFYENENEDLLKLPDELLSAENKNEKISWVNDREKNEKLVCKNLIKSAVYYMELSNRLLNTKRLLNENIFDLANANLIDPSKLPKDISSQILENDYLTKKRNKVYLNSVTQKPVCDTFDVFYFFKSAIKESEFFTLSNEESIKNISKLHKFLKINSTNYNTKCYVDILPCQEISDINLEIVKKDQISIFWVNNTNEVICPSGAFSEPVNGNWLNLIYVIGPNSIITEFKDYQYGRVFFNKSVIIQINKNLLDLKISLKNSLTLSEQKKKRDLKYLQIEYNKLVVEFACEFLKTKKIYSDLGAVSKLFSNEALGEVTIENIDFWLNITNMSSFSTANQRFNSIFNDVNSKLFA